MQRRFHNSRPSDSGISPLSPTFAARRLHHPLPGTFPLGAGQDMERPVEPFGQTLVEDMGIGRERPGHDHDGSSVARSCRREDGHALRPSHRSTFPIITKDTATLKNTH